VNINMLRDIDDDAGWYAAACAADPAATWTGANLYVTRDLRATYSFLATLVNEATMGTLTNALGDFHSGNMVDELNSINVVLSNGSLSSTTYDGLLSGVNTCIVGDEILYFRDAILEGDGSYTLTGLLRGRRGSEYAMTNHVASERFILVNTPTITRVPQVTADIGSSYIYKAVMAGGNLSSAPEKAFTNLGTGLKPYSVAQLGGGRNAAGDVIINWVRRTRISGEWRDNVDVLLGETSEAYEVEIWDSTYTTLKRTITGLSAQSATYTAAQQTTDFGALQATVYVTVYQLSGVVGRGHPANGSI